MSVRLEQNEALIIVPGAVNYFYKQAGRRLAEALRAAGWQVEVNTLKQARAQSHEWVFVVNLSEVLFECENELSGLNALREMRKRRRRMAQVLLECADTNWFSQSYDLGEEVGVDVLFDLGLHDQSATLSPKQRKKYKAVFNGLTPSELAQVEQWRSRLASEAEKRPVPWVVIGHCTAARVNLVARLAREFDPQGFCYLPRVEPVTEDGPHLNEAQFHHVLAKSRYQVWCSHHEGFYLEGERFRASLLAGGVPLKVILHASEWRPPTVERPFFEYLLLDEGDFPDQIRALDFAHTRQRFAEEFCRLPGLSESMVAACQELG